MGHLSSTNAVPAMTSAATPSGVASASSTYNPSTNDAWRAFDRTGSYWATNNTIAGWIKYKFPNPIVVQNYNITSHSTEYQGSPKNWTFEGSNDDTNWTVLDTQSNQTGWTASQMKKYVTDNKQSYQYYRLNINGISGNHARITMTGWEMYEYIYDDKFLLSINNQYIAYAPMTISATSLIPKMTSNNTPRGIVEASSTWGTNYPYRAFDGVSGGNGTWLTSYASLPAWISYEFSSLIEIKSYAIKPASVARAPKKWTIEGYTSSQWVLLDQRENITDWVTGTKKIFTISKSGNYKKYRLNIEQINGDISYLEIDEIEMYGVTSYSTVKYLSLIQEDDFIRHGLDRSAQIDLSDTVKHKGYVSKNSTIVGSGKVFRHSVDTTKTLIKGATIT